MENALYVVIGTILGTIIGGLISGIVSYVLQRQRFEQEMRLKHEEFRTEFMAENTAKHFLSHKSFTDRSFDTLQKHLGGFDDNELRKILVRAGAIRIIREDGSEWWRLLSRMEEYLEKKTAAKEE
jgi:hypothetical protein